MSRPTRGEAALARALRAAGARIVFGVPGTQNVALVEALARAGVRLVTGTSELAASFMANGYARVSRRSAVLTTIPGPGFAFALPGVAEARLDEIPLVWLCIAPRSSPDGRAMLQALPQAEIAGPLVKEVLALEPGRGPAALLADAVRIAEEGAPGPVLVHLDPGLLERIGPDGGAGAGCDLGGPPPLRASPPPPAALEAAVALVREARRPLLHVGAGGLDAPREVRAVAELLGCPVFTTTSARGVVPEDDPRLLPVDAPGIGAGIPNEVLARADLVLGLGVALSHNGSLGYRLRIPRERFLHVDARPDGPPPPYPARMAVRADVRTFLAALLRTADLRRGVEEGLPAGNGADGWRPDELVGWRARLEAAARGRADEPVPAGRGAVGEVFERLRRALPREGRLVLDSGRHQVLARRHHRALVPNGLLAPTNLQSMGFALPAAIGAALADPAAPVVALVGDGGFQLSAMELLTARREGVPITCVVFRDGELALIADQQRSRYGRSRGARLRDAGPAHVAAAAGFGCFDGSRAEPDGRGSSGRGGRDPFVLALAREGGAVVDVPLGRSIGSRTAQLRAWGGGGVRRALGPSATRRLARLLKRRS